MNSSKSAHPDPSRGPSLGAAIGAVAVAGIGLYLAIRIPTVRNAVLALTPHRASGELAFHVLDIMQAVHEASDAGQQIALTSTCERPAMLPLGLAAGLVA